MLFFVLSFCLLLYFIVSVQCPLDPYWVILLSRHLLSCPDVTYQRLVGFPLPLIGVTPFSLFLHPALSMITPINGSGFPLPLMGVSSSVRPVVCPCTAHCVLVVCPQKKTDWFL